MALALLRLALAVSLALTSGGALARAGEKTAPESFAGSFVRRTKFVPSRLMAQMSGTGSTQQSKTIRLPPLDPQLSSSEATSVRVFRGAPPV